MPKHYLLGRVLGCWMLIGLIQISVVAIAQEIGPDSARVGQDYHVGFLATFVPQEGIARVTIAVVQNRRALRELDFDMSNGRFLSISGDGGPIVKAGRVVWQPPRAGGNLTYDYVLEQRRGAGYDAKITGSWAIARLGDLFPRANARAAKSAEGIFEAKLTGPESWAIESQYGDLTQVKEIPNTDQRKYVRPTGWVVAGELGVRREKIGDHRIVVAAPVGLGFRRLDTLAALRWTMPTFTAVFTELPRRILIVGAPQGMWRGALSAPGSAYVHADLPVISENGTSILLHEMTHLAGLHSADEGADWIVEGLAEYYGLEILRRSGGLSEFRFNLALDDLRRWVTSAHGEISDPSTGANTAAAVLLFHELAVELETAGSSLDVVLKHLLSGGQLSHASLAYAAREQLGGPSKALRRVP